MMDQSDAEPVAWQLVPKEPTEHQYEAMKVLAECMLEAANKIDVSLLYKTGLQAAPPRPDASAGLIEAAEWHEQQAEEVRIEAEQAGEPSPAPQVVTHLASAYEFRRRAARAANRSAK